MFWRVPILCDRRDPVVMFWRGRYWFESRQCIAWCEL